jgi:hypothetical protein
LKTSGTSVGLTVLREKFFEIVEKVEFAALLG